jgi:hypothetical protein
MRTVSVTLLPGQTITALIRLYNAHAMSQADLHEALGLYNMLNPGVAYAGTKVSIPVLAKYENVIHGPAARQALHEAQAAQLAGPDEPSAGGQTSSHQQGTDGAAGEAGQVIAE